MSLKEENEALQRELQAAHEMLAFALLTQEERQIVIYKSALVKGLPESAQIEVIDDIQKNAFVLRLVGPIE